MHALKLFIACMTFKCHLFYNYCGLFLVKVQRYHNVEAPALIICLCAYSQPAMLYEQFYNIPHISWCDEMLSTEKKAERIVVTLKNTYEQVKIFPVSSVKF